MAKQLAVIFTNLCIILKKTDRLGKDDIHR